MDAPERFYISKRFFISSLILVVLGFVLVLLPSDADRLQYALVLWALALILFAVGIAAGIPALSGWKRAFAIISFASIIIILVVIGLIIYGCSTTSSIIV